MGGVRSGAHDRCLAFSYMAPTRSTSTTHLQQAVASPPKSMHTLIGLVAAHSRITPSATRRPQHSHVHPRNRRQRILPKISTTQIDAFTKPTNRTPKICPEANDLIYVLVREVARTSASICSAAAGALSMFKNWLESLHASLNKAVLLSFLGLPLYASEYNCTWYVLSGSIGEFFPIFRHFFRAFFFVYIAFTFQPSS